MPVRPFRVARPAPGELRVEFPRRPGWSSISVLAIGLVMTALSGWPLVQALRSKGATSKYGLGLGMGVMATAFGVALLGGRRTVAVTGRSLTHRLAIAGLPVMTSEIAKEDIDSVQAEEEGGPCIRVYPRTGPRAHIEDFASKEERDWFLGALRKALEDPEGAFRDVHGSSGKAGKPE